MIVGSIVFVAVAIGLLVGGLFRGSDLLYVSSIAASLLAAIALVVGVRQYPRVGLAGPTELDLRPGPLPARTIGRAGVPRRLPTGRGAVGVAARPRALDPADGDAEPPDEPAEQPPPTGDGVAIAGLDAEVVVVDGRPRYHRADCLHLLGRDRERLSAAEAIRLGFTPCAQCAPATALVAGPPSA